MIKKLLVCFLLTCCCAAAHSQSIALLDLINLTSLKAEQIDDYFVSGHSFRYHSSQEGPDFTVKHYRTYQPGAIAEEVITGQGTKDASGAYLYTASYLTGNSKYIVSMINQTKSVGMKLTFQGTDAQWNIYIYDSSLYHMVVKLNFPQTQGSVDVSQKVAFTQ